MAAENKEPGKKEPEKKETGEQKLLKIIENPPAAGAAPSKPAAQPPATAVAQEVAAAVKGTGLPPFSLPGLLSPLTALLGGKSQGTEISFGPREINKLLLLGLGATAVFFSFSFLNGMGLLKQKVNFSIATSMSSSEDILAPAMKVFSDYLKVIQERNIFQPYEKKVVVEENVPAEVQKITSLVKNFKLVGISWLDSPESASAMIEDTQSGTTHFLKAGEKINDVTVKIIYADRVILSYEDEETAIRL